MTKVNQFLKQHKLSLSFVIIIALFLSFGIFTIKGIFTLGNLTRTIYEHPLVVSNASLTAALNITKMHRSMKDVVLSTTAEQLSAAQEAVAASERIVYEQLDLIKERILGQEGKALEIQTRKLFVSWTPIRDEVVQLLKSGDRMKAIGITKGKGAEHVHQLESKMLELTSYARSKADTFLSMAESNQSKLENITIVLTCAGVILSIAIAMVATYIVRKAEEKLNAEKDKLQTALSEIRTLRGIIPICSHCKQIRDDEGLWKQIEEYIRSHSEAEFSHSICPRCLKKHYPEHS